MTATDLLKNSLDTLAAKLKELSADYSSELQPICEALSGMTARGLETTDFRRNLKELARAVIQLRTGVGSPARFRELPVPPYDLWLPFKAEDLRTADSADLIEAGRIFNAKVGQMDFNFGCSDDDDKEKSEPDKQTQR